MVFQQTRSLSRVVWRSLLRMETVQVILQFLPRSHKGAEKTDEEDASKLSVFLKAFVSLCLGGWNTLHLNAHSACGSFPAFNGINGGVVFRLEHL